MTVIKLSISPDVSRQRFVNISNGHKIIDETAEQIGDPENATNEQVKLTDIIPQV